MKGVLIAADGTRTPVTIPAGCLRFEGARSVGDGPPFETTYSFSFVADRFRVSERWMAEVADGLREANRVALVGMRESVARSRGAGANRAARRARKRGHA